MQKIMFNEWYGMQSAVFDGRKTQTRREPFYSYKEIGCVLNKNGKLECYNDFNGNPIHISRYAVGEIVAVAQSYSDIFDEAENDYFNDIYSNFRNAYATESKGWKNKMFVKADLMPHHMKITDICCERLQDITYDDCLKEGVYERVEKHPRQEWEPEYTFGEGKYHAQNPRAAFAALICKLNGKKFWDSNPYVIVYEFELID